MKKKVKSNESLRLAFGSCNKARLYSQDFWDKIKQHNPSMFLWTGDAVYSKNHSLAALSEALDELLMDPYYKSFISNVEIDGVWDDHDMGVNDGGAFVDDIFERRDVFKKFLKSSRSSISESRIPVDTEELYHSREIYSPSGKHSVNLIFLDTRFERNDQFIGLLGNLHYPFAAFVSAALRALSGVLGFGSSYNGDVLGEEQWSWLRDTLLHSSSDIQIIVSSIQVLTTNPVVESWGHFPKAKERLFDVLSEYTHLRVADGNRIGNIVLLSGDVHHAEISSTFDNIAVGGVTEVTSSGLTHSCALASGLVSHICPTMLSLFNTHRVGNKMHVEKNFGMLDIEWMSDLYGEVRPVVNIEIVDVNSNLPVIRHVVKPFHVKERVAYEPQDNIEYQYHNFPVIPLFPFVIVGIVILVCVRACFGRIHKKLKEKEKQS